jgi:hypothetical protein
MKRATTILPAAIAAVLPMLWSPSAHAADPTTADCLAASDNSVTLINQHKLRAARSQLLVCGAASCPADVRKECFRHVDEINAAIPTIVFEARDPAGRDIGAVRVTMDGELMAERLQGTPLSLDPGEHAFVFEAAGQPPVKKQLIVRESQKDRRETITFGEPTPPPTPQPAPAGATWKVPEGSPPQPEPSAAGLGTQKILALVAGGVGVVGLGLGTVFGLQAMSKRDDATKACPKNTCPDANGVSLWDDAQSAGTLSTVFFVVGGVGLAGGAALWFTAKAPESAQAASAQIGIGPGVVQVKGTW